MSGRRAATGAPTLGEQLRRASDRLVTPATVIVVVVCGTVLVLAAGGAAVWAELHGGRGTVVIDTVVKTLGALGSLIAAGLLWVGRHQLARIEVAAATSAAAAAAPALTDQREPTPPTAPDRSTADTAPATLPPGTDSPVRPAGPGWVVQYPGEQPEPAVVPADPPPPARADDTSLIPIVRHRA